jgi:phospholipase/carboxylesterase
MSHDDPRISRRTWLALSAATCAGFACGPGQTDASAAQAEQQGRLTSRPREPRRVLAPGRHALGLGGDTRDGFVFLPAAASDGTARPLTVMLHGAGGRAAAFARMLARAETLGIVVLAPDSRGGTWDAIRGDFGPDVAFLDRALAHVFDRCRIDPQRIAIGGFSDGASYGLSLGLRNGDLFTHILAFSPGFFVPGDARGQPSVFISHGTRDEILPIDRTSRTIVPLLERARFHVRYREFDGPHTVPPDIEDAALRWFVGESDGG